MIHCRRQASQPKGNTSRNSVSLPLSPCQEITLKSVTGKLMHVFMYVYSSLCILFLNSIQLEVVKSGVYSQSTAYLMLDMVMVAKLALKIWEKPTLPKLLIPEFG